MGHTCQKYCHTIIKRPRTCKLKLQNYDNVMSHVSPCHVTFVSMSCYMRLSYNMCLHVMSHLSPCHVPCVSMSCHMCLCHISLCHATCVSVRLYVSPCHVTCLSMQCCMSLHVMSHVSPYCVICISMSCCMCLYVIYVYPCHVTWERYSIQILVNAMNKFPSLSKYNKD